MERRAGRSEGGGGAKNPEPGDKVDPPRDPDRPEPPQPPAFHDPEIDQGKIAGYAMNPDHPVGGNKYRVINSATGLGPEDVVAVEQQIRDGICSGAPILGKADQYGQRWAVDVPLTGPGGTIVVRTAWILDVGETRPRLVTISFPK
jgi:hypothetical protein